MTAAGRFPRYRAPGEDGQTLVVPPWDDWQSLVATNRRQRAQHAVEIAGRPLPQLADEAGRAALKAALQYTRSYADVPTPPATDVPLILTGHQPALVHPGVWLKNFAATRLAKQVGGISIHLIVDSDHCRDASVQVPTGTPSAPRTERIAYDQRVAEQPLEERPLVDRAVWDRFGSEVVRTIGSLVPEPLVATWWPRHAVRADLPEKLGLALAQARHRLELDWGATNLELPQSAICQTSPFRRFALHLLRNAASFRAIHNEAVEEYRRAHAIRNHAQPLPNLAADGPWVETPFWIWTADRPQRRALFASAQGDALLLTDRQGWQESLPADRDGQTSMAIEQWESWEGQGVKIRTRALTTTMYARLLLADLFVHGIGGAKYDQITDTICARFFGGPPPAYAILSGTLRLPIEHARVADHRPRRLRRELRELRYHPETACGDLLFDGVERDEVASLIARKRRWVETRKTPANAAERHREIVAANEGLQSWLAPQRERLRRELSDAQDLRRATALLEFREYPFCLFPLDPLRNFLLDFSSSIT